MKEIRAESLDDFELKGQRIYMHGLEPIGTGRMPGFICIVYESPVIPGQGKDFVRLVYDNRHWG